MPEVDPSLPMLLDPEGTGRAYHLLRRSFHSKTGERALLMAGDMIQGGCLTTPLTIVSPFRTGKAVWCGSAIHTGERLPDTVLEAMAGRPVGDVVAHPAARGRRITRAMTDAHGNAVVRMDDRYTDIGTLPGVTSRLRAATTARIGVDKVTDLLVWLRLRHHARRRNARSDHPCGGFLGFDIVTALFATCSVLLAWLIGTILAMSINPSVINGLGVQGRVVMLTLPQVSSMLAGVMYARWRAFRYRATPDEMLKPPWLVLPRDDV